MDTSNWRDQLLPETRRLTLNNMQEEEGKFHPSQSICISNHDLQPVYIEKDRGIYQLKLGYHPGDDDEFLELQKVAQNVEQKSYAGATSQSDYFEKIASKMLLLEKAREREWRSQLHPDSRQRIVNKIAETLRRHLPSSGPEGSQELWRIAQRYEEKIFTAATSQSDYLRKISLKMLSMESTSQRGHGQPSNPFV